MIHGRISNMESMLRLKISGAAQRPRRRRQRQPSPRSKRHTKVKRRGTRESGRSLLHAALTTPPVPAMHSVHSMHAMHASIVDHPDLPTKALFTTDLPPPPTVASTPSPIIAALELMGDGYLVVSHGPLAMASFTVETVVCISSASKNPNKKPLRKHNGLVVDDCGNFLRWSCCNSEDSDPLSWCPNWDGKGVVHQPGIICRHASFILSTTFFTVINNDGTVTNLDDFHIPVDRFVHFAASFDGCYLRVYINGDLVSAKCSENNKKRVETSETKDTDSKNECNDLRDINPEGQLVLGEKFVGMLGYFRVWERERQYDEILMSIHPWFTKRDSDAPDAAHILAPRSSGTNAQLEGLVLSLPICEIQRLCGFCVATEEIEVQAELGGKWRWCINPPAYLGAKRLVSESKSSLEQLPTTITTNKGAKRWGWRSLHKLAEQLRSNGKIMLTISWNFDDKANNFENLKAANRILLIFATQDFSQDWLVCFYNTIDDDDFGASLSYFDIDGIQQVDELHFLRDYEMTTPKSNETLLDAVQNSSALSILQSVEACIRGATTKTHRLVHAHLRHAFRSRLWSEEYGSGHEEMTFKQIFKSLDKLSVGTSVGDLMLSQHGMLPRKRKRTSSRMTQMQFTEGLWIAGKESHMPDICRHAIQLANRAADRQMDPVTIHMQTAARSATAVTQKIDSVRLVTPDQGFAELPRMHIGNMMDLTIEGADTRLVSYSVTAEWQTYTLLHPKASLETTSTLDVFCVALDGRHMPIETINSFNQESFDGAVNCRNQEHKTTVPQLFKDFENSQVKWVTRRLTFHFDLNTVISDIKSFALVLGSNGSEEEKVFDAVGNVTLRLDRVTHDEQVSRVVTTHNFVV